MKLSDEHFEQLTAYLDGELNAQDRREVEALLARDPQAAALLESLRQVSNSVAALPRELAPTGLSAAVQERLARRSLLDNPSDSRHELPRLVIWTNRLAIAACLGLVCTAGWLGLQSNTVHAPAVAENEPNRAIAVKKDGFAKDGVDDKLAFNTSPGHALPLGAAAPSGGRIDVPATPIAEPVMVAHRDAGELEKRLNRSGVSNVDLQNADLSDISNQLVIETDDTEVRDAIVRVVADFAHKNKIPDVNSNKLPEPVQASQSFYVVSQPSSKQHPIAKSEETWIAMNAPFKTTQELMDCVSKVRAQKKGDMQVEINGCQMETSHQASQILAGNFARNQRLLTNIQDSSKTVPVDSPPPPTVSAPPVEAWTGGSPKDIRHLDEEANDAKREAKNQEDEGNHKNTKSHGEPKPAAAQTSDPLEAGPIESRTGDDSDSESAKKELYRGGRNGEPPPRSAMAKAGRNKNEGLKSGPSEIKAPVASPAVTAPPADACVTLSICVRNPTVQRPPPASATATQPSDTIRPSGATSMPQTSMPAAGANRE